ILVPSDTEVDGWGPFRKIGGILAEGVPMSDGGPAAVAIGIGITGSQSADELPVPSATSLALAGAQHVDREGLLVALVDAQIEVARRWRDAGGHVTYSGLADEIARVCVTLGATVRVELPGGAEVAGVAIR